MSDPLDPLFAHALEDWEDPKRHGALIELAARTGRLAELAGKYRALGADPDRGVRARKQLEAIALVATQMLLATKTPAPAKVPRPILLSAVAVTAMLLGYLAYALLRR